MKKDKFQCSEEALDLGKSLKKGFLCSWNYDLKSEANKMKFAKSIIRIIILGLWN